MSTLITQGSVLHRSQRVWARGSDYGSMKCAIYVRVSPEDPRCEMQLSKPHAYCRKVRWESVAYVDLLSGNQRPQLEQLLMHARYGRFQGVVVWKLDRFGQSLPHLVTNLRVLDAAGVRFLCPASGIDIMSNNPQGRSIVHLLGEIAAMERSLTIEGTIWGLRRYRELDRRDRHSKSRKDLP